VHIRLVFQLGDGRLPNIQGSSDIRLSLSHGKPEFAQPVQLPVRHCENRLGCHRYPALHPVRRL
jgi:hypothetical protein